VMSPSNKQTVFILIEDEDVSLLFSELIRANGLDTQIVASEKLIPDAAKVLTEPRFYDNLTEAQRQASLVIGNKTALGGIHTATLSRPLTEDKIINALEAFLE
jgi:hypothetical protein